MTEYEIKRQSSFLGTLWSVSEDGKHRGTSSTKEGAERIVKRLKAKRGDA